MNSISFILLFLLLMQNNIYSQESLLDSKKIKIPEGISVDGVPPIPAELIEDVKPYTIERFSYLQDWHPIKKEMLILTQLGTATQAYIVKKPGGLRRQVTFYDEAINQCLFNPKGGESIIVQKDKGGDEYYQIYHHNISTGKTYLLTDGGKSHNYNLHWNKKGDKLFYTSFKANKPNSEVYVVDPEVPGSTQLFLSLEEPNWTIEDISIDDKKVLLSIFYQGSNTENTLWLYNAESKTKTLLLPATHKSGSYGNATFTNDGKGIHLITSQDSEFSQLAFYDLEKRSLKILTHLKWGVRRASLSPDGKKIAFTVNEAGNARGYIYSITNKTYKPIKGLPIGFLAGMKWTNNSETLGFQFSTSYANSDVYEWNSETGKVTPWIQNELGGVDASLIPAPQLIKWKSFDSLEISGFLYPASKRFKGKRPVIINIHGGPVMQSLPLYNSHTNYYTNELGVSVIFPNIRGSAGYGKTFTELDNGLNKENAVKDIGFLLNWIASQPELDSDKVMVTGGSYGGYMTYRTAIEYNKRIHCAVEEFGLSDLQSFKKSIDTVYKYFFLHEYGDDRDSLTLVYFNKVSPLKNADKITMPIFIIQGKNDPRIPYTESEQMVKTIKGNGGTVWYLLANDEGHGFLKQANQDFLFYATVEFIKKYLLN
jgi:dipeptidyl aminopeptidase/acylaminoacyl peptidase